MIAMTEREIFARWHNALALRLLAESRRISSFIERRLTALLLGWFGVTILIGSTKLLLLVTAHPKIARFDALFGLIVTYLAIAAAPAAGFALTSGSFPLGQAIRQPAVRLARIGRWSQVSPDQARSHAKYGMSGLLVSLVAGLLLSIAMRLGEYFVAMPAIPSGAPAWALTMFRTMTFDLILFSFLYSVCITMALRGAPMFPRMLCYTWLCDLLMQVAIARHTADAGGLPADVAASLQPYLLVNIKKIMISVVIWLPYLLISNRINVTFRQRVRSARAAPMLAVSS